MRTSLIVLALVAAAVELFAQDAADESYKYQDRVVVQQTVEDVMARPEFERLRDENDEQSKNPAWLERILDWIEDWLAGAEAQQGRSGGTGAAYLMYGIAFVIVTAALAFILKAVFESAQARELSEELEQARLIRAGAAPGETPPEEFWTRANELAASGNEKLAIRELLLGAMSSLERRGRIRYRRGLTNRDYFWAASGHARSSLATIIAAFERVYFGRRRATADVFRECANAYRDGFELTGPVAPEPLKTETL